MREILFRGKRVDSEEWAEGRILREDRIMSFVVMGIEEKTVKQEPLWNTKSKT